jgi:hypothetical protein
MKEFYENFEHPIIAEYIAEPLWAPPIDVSCLTLKGLRVYAWVDGGKIQLGPGITGCFETTTDQSWKVRWMRNVGFEAADQRLAEATPYGTLLHGQRAMYDRYRVYELDECLSEVIKFIAKHDVPGYVVPEMWAKKLKEDMLAYLVWCQRVNFEPVAVEVPLRSKKYGVATRIDALGYIDIGSQGYYKKGSKKEGLPKGDILRKLAIVDTKSNRAGHSYNTHALQVLFCEHLVRVNYGVKEDIVLANWSPAEWHNTPQYHFKQHFADEESKKLAWEELEMCIKLTHLRTRYTGGTKHFKGTMTPDTDVSSLYTRTSYIDMIKNELLADLPEELHGCVA